MKKNLPLVVLQSQSEGAGGKPVVFREALTDLIKHIATQGSHGGLSAWQLATSRGPLPMAMEQARTRALGKIAQAIKDGPASYSGGSLDAGPVFTYENQGRQVAMAADLWRELTLLGHWIVDAVVIRWAALTERFAQRQGITSGKVLLARPEPERAAAVARQVYLDRGVDRCAWTLRPITASGGVLHGRDLAVYAATSFTKAVSGRAIVSNPLARLRGSRWAPERPGTW